MSGWVLGADGSHWSGNILFKKMYQAGAKYYIGKASDSYRGSGKMFEDTKFDEHMSQAFAENELLLGCFHWLQPDTDPYLAAEFYLERYYRYPFHFPPILDFEEQYAYQKLISKEPKIYEPTGLESHYCWCAEVWLDKVEKVTGRLPIVYTAKWFTDHFKEKHLGFLRRYPLWVAHYPNVMFSWTRPRLPYPWDNWVFWQFSADGNGRGAEFGATAKSMDLNYFQGNYAELMSLLDEETIEPEDRMYVIEMLGNMSIRQGAGTQYNIVGYALKGEVHHSAEEQNGWYRIDKGWISGMTNWTRITTVAGEPEPVPVPLTVEERLERLEKEVFGG